MPRDSSPVRRPKLLSLLQNNSIGWINNHIDNLKAEGVETDKFITKLFGNAANRVLCCKLALTRLFSNDSGEYYLPYNWIDDQPDRLVYCIESCEFYLCEAVVKIFAERRWKNILRFLLFNRLGSSARWFWNFPSPSQRSRFIEMPTRRYAMKVIHETVRTEYQISIRNFCLTYFALNLECNSVILEAYSVCYPKDLSACFK